MIHLAADPGTEETGFVLYDSETHGILDFGIERNELFRDRLLALRNNPSPLPPPTPDSLALEMIASYGMPVGAEVFRTCVWIGRFIEAWGGPFRLVTRIECKSHLCHSARAKDPHIRQALLDKFGLPGTKKAPGRTYGITKHCWAALAVAVTAAETKPKEQEGAAA